jgi:hypothetical protein
MRILGTIARQHWGELPEINRVTGTLYDFATEAGKIYYFKRK